jgi:hypothetical protein
VLFREKKESDGIFKSIIAAYAILVLHVLLLGGIAVATVFIKGVADYMGWILLGGFVLIGTGCYIFFRFLRRESKSIRDVMNSPMLGDRPVEVSLLGGFASIKIGSPGNGTHQIGHVPAEPVRQLESTPSQQPQKDVSQINGIFSKPHVMPDEYDVSLKKIMTK